MAVNGRPRTRNEERAYGTIHRKRRQVLIAQLAAIGAAACPKCGLPMTADMRLHLDHSDPAAKQRGEPGDQLCHAVCNQSDGGRIGMAVMRAQAAGQLPFLPPDKPAPKATWPVLSDNDKARLHAVVHRPDCLCEPGRAGRDDEIGHHPLCDCARIRRELGLLSSRCW